MRRPLVLAAVLGACLLPAAAHAQTAADPAAVARGEDVMQVNQAQPVPRGLRDLPRPGRRGHNRAPDLHGVGRSRPTSTCAPGALAVPGEPPLSNPPSRRTRSRRSIAYVGSLGGPAIPTVDPAAGDLSEGERLFTLFCAGCHGKLAKGGVVTGAIAPSLDEATQVQIAEAIRIGPFVMPWFDEKLIDQRSSTPSWPTSRRPRTPTTRAAGTSGHRAHPRGDGGLFIGLRAAARRA